MRRTTNTLLAVVAMMLAANLIVTLTQSASGNEAFGGSPGPCCFKDGSCQILQADVCAQSGGCWQGTAPLECGDIPCCRSDVNNDGDVGILDFLQVIGEWGPCG